MPERPDLRDIAANIADALGGFDRDQLLDVLTYVFKEYVVEGPPPLLAGPSETVADLEGLSFAQLIQTLQTRLELPELGLFQVEGERVSVRVGGVLQPLDAAQAGTRGANISEQSRPAEPTHARPAEPVVPTRPAEAAVPPAQVPQRPTGRDTADEAISRGRGDLAGHAGAATRPAPRPTGGVSVRGQPTGDAPGAPAARPADEPRSQEPAADDDASSIRFSLLELD
jgi:hypothetical protein